VAEALNLPEKSERAQALAALKTTIQEELAAEFPENLKDVGNVLEDIEYHTMRNQVLTPASGWTDATWTRCGPISCEVGMLPRTHGSALFTPRPDAGAGVGDPRHDAGRAAHRLDRRGAGDHQVVHAALQLSAVLDW